MAKSFFNFESARGTKYREYGIVVTVVVNTVVVVNIVVFVVTNIVVVVVRNFLVTYCT